jgi:hypothetical protein
MSPRGKQPAAPPQEKRELTPEEEARVAALAKVNPGSAGAMRLRLSDPDVARKAQELGILAGAKGFKLTPELHQRIVGLVQMGNYLAVAAQACGVGENTLQRWLRRGRDVEARLRTAFGEEHGLTEHQVAGIDDIEPNDYACWRLWIACDKARAEAQAYAVGQVRNAMKDNWTAAMTYLERSDPKRWRRRDLHEVVASEGDEHEDDAALLGGEASEKLHDALQAAARESAGELVEGEATELD